MQKKASCGGVFFWTVFGRSTECHSSVPSRRPLLSYFPCCWQWGGGFKHGPQSSKIPLSTQSITFTVFGDHIIEANICGELCIAIGSDQPQQNNKILRLNIFWHIFLTYARRSSYRATFQSVFEGQEQEFMVGINELHLESSHFICDKECMILNCVFISCSVLIELIQKFFNRLYQSSVLICIAHL